MNDDKKKPEQVNEAVVTYEMYHAMPDDEHHRYEISEGVLEALGAPSVPHQSIAYDLVALVKSDCRNDYLIYGDVDVVLSQMEVRSPDLVMVHRSRSHIVTYRAIEGIPDLVCEILSPHSLRRDKVKKMNVYAKYGVPEYWIVDPASRSLEQFLLSEDHYELHDVYISDEPIVPERLTCVRFTMNDVFAMVENIPDK